MKNKTTHFPFKSNFFKEQDPFHFVLLFFIIFFGTAIFFSIPTFYDYKKYNQKIEETINSEFKIKLQNLENISFKFIPSPHLVIKKADFKIRDNETDSIAELKNIKVYISISDFYKSDTFKIKKITVSKANLYLNSLSLTNFIQNLKKSVVNHFVIKNSTLFFKDKKNEIILISKIKNLDYKNDFVNKKKILKIYGNIFDSNYKFKYFIDYEQPNIQNAILELKNPNLTFENSLIEDFYSSNSDQSGKLNIEFLNNKNILNGLINFNPFHFNLEVDLKKIDLNEIEQLLYLLHMSQSTKYDNLSGNIKVNFKNINFKSIKNGSAIMAFESSKIILKEKLFFLDNFASIEVVDFEYLDNIDQILQMKIKLNIFDSVKFNRFLFHYKKNRIEEKNLYFIYQYNANNLTSFISQISNKGFLPSAELYQFNNFQQLKNLLRDDKVFKLD